MSNIYSHADIEISALNEMTGAAFQNLSTQLRFDELNAPEVKRLVSRVYRTLNTYAIKAFKRIVRKVYRDTLTEIGSNRDMDEEAVAAVVAAIVKRYEPITEYRFDYEIARKQNRTVEGIMASSTRQKMLDTLRKSARLTQTQLRQYCDIMTDDARLECFRRNGIGLVVWHTLQDERVCPDCELLDGEVFPIDNVPDKHRNCRCYLTAYTENDRQDA